MKKLALLIAISFMAIYQILWAANANTLLQNSQQLIVISADNSNTLQASLARYQRSSTSGSWQKVGAAIPVVLGRNGMAWQPREEKPAAAKELTEKHEGDSRTPIGIFAIGPAFGFAAKEPQVHLNYLSLTSDSICVDDRQSSHYNRIVNSSQIPQQDWRSGEQMRSVPEYQLGAVIQYNQNPSTPGAGSCYFLHQWRDANTGTSGCVAMSGDDIRTVVTWLDPSKHPMIAIFPAGLSPLKLAS